MAGKSMIGIVLLTFLNVIQAMDNLTVAFQWKKLDFHFKSEEDRQNARNKWYTDYNNIPTGIEIYKDKLFITIPRWREGTAASLAYIKLTDSKDSPRLYPYPDWESHKPEMGKSRKIESPFRIRADKCARLWVLDSGVSNILESNTIRSKPKLLIYDLKTDKLEREYFIPEDQYSSEDSLFCNIVVEDYNCDDSYAYLADLGLPGMVVYSFKMNKSWLVKHHFFNLEPLASNMTVAGQNFHWYDGLFGMALKRQPNTNFSILYFHPMISYNEFTVSTEVLRNESIATNLSANYHMFKLLGSRGPKGQSGASFYHENSKVLFYTLLNLDAVACWRTTTNYTLESQGRIHVSNETLVFPCDLKVDENDNLWVLSNQLPVFMMNPQKFEEDYHNYHFRILKAKVSDALKRTSCDAVMAPSSGNNNFAIYQLIFVTIALSKWVSSL